MFGKNNHNDPPKDKAPAQKAPKSGFLRFKDWLREQNATNEFAKRISDGTTVYFSDDFAAAYDLSITGLGESNNRIMVQLNLDREQNGELNEDFLEIAVETWRKMKCEVWYLDTRLKWIIVDNENGRKHYKSNELIQSSRIDFQFKLEDVV